MSASSAQYDDGYGTAHPLTSQQSSHRSLDVTQQARRVHPAYRQQSGDYRQQAVRTSSQNGRFHVRDPPPEYARLAESTSYANLYNIAPFDDYTYYPQSSQWPTQNTRLNQPYQPHNSSSTPLNILQRPQNPSLANGRSRSDQSNVSSRPPRARSSDPPQSRRRPPQHHGSGHWTTDGYSLPPQQRQPVLRPSKSDELRSTRFGTIASQSHPSGTIRQDVRKAPLVLPPSARRGPASYYPQGGPVQPIQEESESQRGSAHSTNLLNLDQVGPSSVATGFATASAVPQSYLDHSSSQEDVSRNVSPIESNDDLHIQPSVMKKGYAWEEVEDTSYPPSPEPLIQPSTHSYALPKSNTVPESRNIGPELVGARNVPSTLRGETNTTDVPITTVPSISPELTSFDSLTPPSEAADQTSFLTAPLSSGNRSIDGASSEVESDREVRSSKELMQHESRSHSPSTQLDEGRVNQAFVDRFRDDALSPTEVTGLKQPMSRLSERVGIRRPSRLNMDSVRDAEARGSLTSLSDLIKRATRLASNLDQGKTASRLGLDWFPDEEEGEKNPSTVNKRRSRASLSDMLSSFPTTGLPIPANGRRDLTRRSSKPLASESSSGPGRRRPRYCCGMRLWLFIALLLLLILLIAAAIIIPVVLVVLPRHQSHDGRSLSNCASELSCDNGGTAAKSADSQCQCLCINGYAGPTCSIAPTIGCTTASVGSYQNATVGDLIPPLIQNASNAFSIPLNGDDLIALFNAANLTCNTENALVTFNSPSKRRSAQGNEIISIVTATTLVYQTASPPATTSTSLAVPTQSSAPAATTSSAAVPSPSINLDFARVAILYILQISQQLDYATTAQESMETYFSTGHNGTGLVSNASNITLGNGFSADLLLHQIRLANGTTVGGSQ